VQRGTADAGDSGRADACMGLVARAYEQSGQKNGVSSGERAWQNTVERQQSVEREIAEWERSSERGLQKLILKTAVYPLC